MNTDFTNGKLILIDKPIQWTSFDVVNYIRLELKKKLNIKTIKVGHAGTLDPLATGLVIVCTGPWTKKINLFQDMEKEYIGEFTLGATTPSYDLETEIDKNYSTEHINEKIIKEAAESFVGVAMQYPPVFSAIKIKGRRAYDYARKGEDVKIMPKEILISNFDILNIEDNIISFRVRCSKGTYIRSLARDFGEKLNSGAYLSKLRRTAIGEYLVSNAISPVDFSLSIQ